MAVPKKKVSKMRSRTRRTHYRIQPPGLCTCPNCRAFMEPHNACTVCGHYKGKQVLKVS